MACCSSSGDVAVSSTTLCRNGPSRNAPSTPVTIFSNACVSPSSQLTIDAAAGLPSASVTRPPTNRLEIGREDGPEAPDAVGSALAVGSPAPEPDGAGTGVESWIGAPSFGSDATFQAVGTGDGLLV